MNLSRPIETLDLSVLLGRLCAHTQEILRLIDEDPQLKKREREDGLIIANSGPTLFEPQLEYQLYAKGIVYRREPEYALVSLPLVKMFNHGMREHSDATSRALEQTPGVRFVFPEKLDGTMIQLFEDRGQVWLTTRSILEGNELPEETAYVGLARELLGELYPQLLDPTLVAGKSLTFEMIHPRTRQVTNYGAQRRLVLLAIFERDTCRYQTLNEIKQFGEANDIEVARALIEDDDFHRGVDRLRELLEQDPSVPEGSIVCFERDGQVVHRVKVKTEEYLRHFSMRYKISTRVVTEYLWDKPHLHTWEAYLGHLIEEKMSEEELEAFYREHFDAFLSWKCDVEARHEAILALHAHFCAQQGDCPDDPEAQKAWYKALALWLKEAHAEELGITMTYARRGVLTLQNMMWHMAPHTGFRQLLEEAGVKG